MDEIRTEPLPPRYNVAPTLDVYAVACGAGTIEKKVPAGPSAPFGGGWCRRGRRTRRLAAA